MIRTVFVDRSEREKRGVESFGENMAKRLPAEGSRHLAILAINDMQMSYRGYECQMSREDTRRLRSLYREAYNHG